MAFNVTVDDSPAMRIFVRRVLEALDLLHDQPGHPALPQLPDPPIYSRCFDLENGSLTAWLIPNETT
jgi:hypothetical protein